MLLKKVDACDKLRIPLAQGSAGERKFTLSTFTDGTGLILEFEDGDKYQLDTVSILSEMLKEIVK